MSALSSDAGIPVDRLRSAVRERVERSSLRYVASELRMSPSGLHSFLAGTTPHPSTRRKLLVWYVREVSREPEDADVDAARAALWILLRHLPEERRDAAAAELIESLRSHTAVTGQPLPGWLDVLLKRASPGS